MSEEYNPEENPFEDHHDAIEKGLICHRCGEALVKVGHSSSMLCSKCNSWTEAYERGLKDGQATFLREAKNYVITDPEANVHDLISSLKELLVIQDATGLKDGAPKWMSAKTPPKESGSYLTCSSWDTDGENTSCLTWNPEYQAWNYPHTIHDVGWWMPPIAPPKEEE